MVDLVLAGRKDIVRRENAAAAVGLEGIASLPSFTLSDLSGNAIRVADLEDRVVLVEFWATWCPPCRSTLDWLGRLKRAHGDRLAIVALAVESAEDDVRSVVAELEPKLRWAIADAATAQAFGDVTAVPTLFVFDRQGRTAHVSYGAPPDLHEQVEKQIEGLLGG
jgi:thiol-disulfide isomerase/thioredoxin